MMNMMTSSILYPPPSSLLLNTLSLLNVVGLAVEGVLEVRGTHIAYSKFSPATDPRSTRPAALLLSGRTGMLLTYIPALLAATAASSFLPSIREAPRGLLLAAALTLHFFKRVFEVLFVHKYSGAIRFDITAFFAFSYVTLTMSMIYSQYLSRNLPEPRINLTYAGIALFLVGIIGNFYHHYLLSRLREKGDRAYRIPKGGLFDLVICPHYLFEIITFFGMSLISQTVYPLCFALGCMFYLTGRSIATRKWYVSKFDDFPAGEVKAIVPYIL